MPPNIVDPPGEGNDLPCWASLGFTNIVSTDKGADTTWDESNGLLSAGVTSCDGVTASNSQDLWIGVSRDELLTS